MNLFATDICYFIQTSHNLKRNTNKMQIAKTKRLHSNFIINLNLIDIL